MSFSIPTWLKQDDDLMLGDRPGSSDWFALSDEVGRGRTNHRRDVIKVESLLNQAGLFDLERLDGPWGYANERLDAPIKEYQKRNGLKVDGYLRPDGETINRFREDYGDMFANFPAPTPAMADAHHALRDQGEDGLLIDRWPALKINPHRRLDPLAAKAGFDEWNESWAKHAASANGSFEGIPAELKKYVDQDPMRGIMQARDMTQRWEALRPGEGNKFARAMLQALDGKPDYQSAYLAGEVPQGPPIGTPRADAAQRYAAMVEEGRVAPGDKPPMTEDRLGDNAKAILEGMRNSVQEPGVQVAMATPEMMNAHIISEQLGNTLLTQSGNRPIPPASKLTRGEQPIGNDMIGPIPPVPPHREKALSSADDQKRWEVFNRSLSSMSNLGASEAEVYRDLYAGEGGDWTDPASSASSGVLPSTLNSIVKNNQVPGLEQNERPMFVPTDRRPEVIRAYFDNALPRAGGHKVFDEIEDPAAAKALASSIYFHGSGGGANVIRRAINKAGEESGINVDVQGPIEREAIAAFQQLSSNSQTRDKLLDALADERIAYREAQWAKNKRPLPSGERAAIERYRPGQQ